ncbi:hypothetical protein N7539_005074 [Penicillium diatomitis]|uniref:Uncharacterized protein n=1 Tax=Penicillium diatomitis TaxID=2819901 RepID=A0A9X0BUQ2_9EURO|nr:uncharacterized protein N7539_005074 [Penicillium diatomitis]KAJ5485086.1 hypothetical protein N7539_005074 [Penicillium diatomitis]
MPRLSTSSRTSPDHERKVMRKLKALRRVFGPTRMDIHSGPKVWEKAEAEAAAEDPGSVVGINTNAR